MGTINPLANSLLDRARKCFQTLELGYLYYSAVGKKITGMIPILSSKNNSQELAWTKDHSQKGSMDAATLFWKLRQFNTTKIRQFKTTERGPFSVLG